MAAAVLLTRPQGRNAGLAAPLREAGLLVREAPALEIHVLPGERSLPHSGNLYLFVSRQAVQAYFSGMDAPWPHGAWAAAVGGVTARALRAHVPADCILVPPAGATADSEALLQVIDARQLVPHEAHLLRARHGRDWMAEQLRTRGWSVQDHAVYERTAALLSAADCDFLALPQGCILLVTSTEAVDAIAASLRHHGRSWPGALQAVTLHERIAGRLQYWYAGRPEGALRVSLSAPDDAALIQAILAASRPRP